MILTKSFLSSQAINMGITEINFSARLNENKSFFEFSESKTYDIFLSHSYLDKKSVLALAKLFEECSYSVYIDWLEDTELDRNNVTPATAKKLKNRMNNSKGLAYLATSNATSSKWCPWELGYFDGKKNEKCCILPVLETTSSVFNGQEYLGLYPYLEYEKIAGKDKYEFWVYDNIVKTNYIVLSSWLNGMKPLKHE